MRGLFIRERPLAILTSRIAAAAPSAYSAMSALIMHGLITAGMHTVPLPYAVTETYTASVDIRRQRMQFRHFWGIMLQA